MGEEVWEGPFWKSWFVSNVCPSKKSFHKLQVAFPSPPFFYLIHSLLVIFKSTKIFIVFFFCVQTFLIQFLKAPIRESDRKLIDYHPYLLIAIIKPKPLKSSSLSLNGCQVYTLSSDHTLIIYVIIPIGMPPRLFNICKHRAIRRVLPFLLLTYRHHL